MTKLEVSKPIVLIDSRGPRFSATLTAVLLAIALTTQSIWLISFQLVVFAIGASKGPQFTLYALIFKKFIKPRLALDFESEDVRPPKFAQSVGLIFAIVALTGLITEVTLIFTIATSMAFAAAFLNSAFNYCLGCEVYLLLLRASRK